jgi:hypothetical protein
MKKVTKHFVSFSKKPPKENNRPISENSPNLVTLQKGLFNAFVYN